MQVRNLERLLHGSSTTDPEYLFWFCADAQMLVAAVWGG
jgi:hypothetical protein